MHFTEECDGFFFSHYADTGKDIAAFINNTENILGLSDFSTFRLTAHPMVTWIAPCGFWRICRIKRSLLTLLLRSGLEYSRTVNNYDQALFSTTLAKETKPAIMRFLFGFTKFVGHLPEDKVDETVGWHSIFYMLDRIAVREMLIAEKPSQPSLVGSGSLWN